jgi:hypothetical protein
MISSALMGAGITKPRQEVFATDPTAVIFPDKVPRIARGMLWSNSTNTDIDLYYELSTQQVAGSFTATKKLIVTPD